MTRSKKLLFAALTALLILGAIEVISFFSLRIFYQHWVGLERIHELQAEVGGLIERPATEDAVPGAGGRHEGTTVIHPFLGFVLDSEFSTRARLERGGPDAVDHGFMLFEPGVFHPKSDSKPVIAVTGGSLAYQFVKYAHESFKAELARHSPVFEDAVVVNLAQGGYKQPQQLLAINYLMSLGAHFDIVLNLDGFNEIALPPSENLPKNVYPFFPRNWYFRVKESLDPTQRLAEGHLAYLLDKRGRWARSFASRPLRHSHTAALIWSVRDRHLSELIAEKYQALVEQTKRAKISYAVTGPPWPEGDPEADYRKFAAHWMRSSLLMHRLVEASGGRYFHVLQPNQYVPGSKPMSTEERKVAIREDHHYGRHVAAAYPHLQEFGRELVERGVSFSDQTSVFTEISEPLYVDDCCHLNERGCEILALSIARFMIEELEATSRRPQ